MNNIPQQHALAKKLSATYEAVLTRALHKAHQSGAALHHIIGEVHHEIAALNAFSKNEAAFFKEYVKHDLKDKANYLDSSAKELTEWLRFDWTLIERDFWRKFSAAADKTTLELLNYRFRSGNMAQPRLYFRHHLPLHPNKVSRHALSRQHAWR